MINSQTLIGTLTDAKTIVLDEAVSTPPGRVRVSVEPIKPVEPRPSLQEFLNDLRREQAARGHVPRSADEIQAYLRAERESWGD